MIWASSSAVVKREKRWARGPMTPMCYYGAPELDQRYRNTEGWVRIGDHGLLDAEGRLRIVGRRADTVLRGGYKINLVEVAHILRGHPAVDQSVVLNNPTEDGKPSLDAFVVMQPGRHALTLEKMLAYLVKEVGAQPSQLPIR